MSAKRVIDIEKHLEYPTDPGRAADVTCSKPEQADVGPPSFSMLAVIRRGLLFSVAAWSLLELPIELILAQSQFERLASVAGRLIWVALVFGAMYRKRLINVILLFLCATSSIVVVHSLPMVYATSSLVFVALVIDLLLKVSVLLSSLILSFVMSHSRRLEWPTS